MGCFNQRRGTLGDSGIRVRAQWRRCMCVAGFGSYDDDEPPETPKYGIRVQDSILK